MAMELDEIWRKLKLTEEEEDEEIACDLEPSTEREEQIALCLLAKLHTTRNYNVGVMKSVLKNAWQPTKGVVFKDLDKNLYAVQFFSKVDRDVALNEGPWAFDGHVFLMKEMTGLEQPSEVKFDTVRFWVKALDVPSKRQNPVFAQFLGNLMGSFVGCDEASYSAIDKSLNFRVDLGIDNPIKRKMKVNIEGA